MIRTSTADTVRCDRGHFDCAAGIVPVPHWGTLCQQRAQSKWLFCVLVPSAMDEAVLPAQADENSGALSSRAGASSVAERLERTGNQLVTIGPTIRAPGNGICRHASAGLQRQETGEEGSYQPSALAIARADTSHPFGCGKL